MADRMATGAKDTQELPRAAFAALREYTNKLGPIGIRDMLAAYGGDEKSAKKALAQDLADKKGTKVASQERAINKYLKFEKGEPGETRNPLRNKKTQEQFRELMTRRRPPQNMVISIEGSICYSNTCRDNRKVNIDSIQYPIDVPGMLDKLADGDVAGAYGEIFENYSPEISVEPGPDIDITFF